MEFGTMAGIGGIFVAVIVSMILEGSSPMSIILLPALFLVFVGSFGAAMAGSLVRDLSTVAKHAKKAFLGKPVDAQKSVETIVAMADLARRQGLLALEEMAGDVEDPLLRQGIELTVDGTDPEEIEEILEALIVAKKADDKIGIKFFGDMGGYAPTLGIIGTVIGLIHVLGNLSSPEKLGELIAGAFVATLWGVLSANAIWLPMSSKLKRMSELETSQMQMVLEGVLAVQSGTNPRLVEQKLRSILPAVPVKGAGRGNEKAA
ncbi:MAG TPA: MotA/TolQ/ExbB proton channel family protein [Dermatophilaceae bacterium]